MTTFDSKPNDCPNLGLPWFWQLDFDYHQSDSKYILKKHKGAIEYKPFDLWYLDRYYRVSKYVLWIETE